MFPRGRGEEGRDRSQRGLGLTAEVWRLPVFFAPQVVLFLLLVRESSSLLLISLICQSRRGFLFCIFRELRVSVRLGQTGSELKNFHGAGT